jgi:hypothetical protein
MGSIYRRKRKLPDGAVVESGPYWIKYYRNGRPIRESTETEKESDARQLLKQKEGDVARGVPLVSGISRITMGELLDDLLTDYRVNDKATLQKQEGVCKTHLKPYFGHRRACQITTADVRKYVEGRQQTGASNATINRELAAIKRAFSLAVSAHRLNSWSGLIFRCWKKTTSGQASLNVTSLNPSEVIFQKNSG